MPFVADKIPGFMKTSLSGICMLSPAEYGDFEIHISDMLGFGSQKNYDVLDEVKKIRALKPVCYFGGKEDELVRKDFKNAGSKIVILPGDHHFNNNYSLVVDNILKNISIH
jgi:type IV secretory pathway VirJ component